MIVLTQAMRLLLGAEFGVMRAGYSSSDLYGSMVLNGWLLYHLILSPCGAPLGIAPASAVSCHWQGVLSPGTTPYLLTIPP